MRLLNYQYKTLKELEIFIDKNILNSNSVLVQVFSGDLDIKNVQRVLDTLKLKVPHVHIIGVSTAGEIAGGVMQENSIQIAFSIFEKTNIRVVHYSQISYEVGQTFAKEFLASNTKVVIAFSEALKSDSELFLDGYSSVNQNIPISGGNAGDNYEFKKTFIICEDKIKFDGIVLCTLESDSLNVYANYSLGWNPIGKEMVVTKADNNIIYEIDNIPVKELYEYYLGDKILNDFPASVIEFPLVKTENEAIVVRSIVSQNGDNGFVYAGHFSNGDKVKFAIGNVEEILDKAKNLYENIVSSPVEATFIYSCSVRKMFLKEQLNYEFGLIEQIAPASGFFTYGEFYHTQTNNQILNITTTTLSLSESDNINQKTEIELKKFNPTTLNSLINLVNISDKELNQYKKLLDNSSIVSKTDIKGYITYVNDEFCKVSGYSREELIGKKHNIVKHPDSDKTIFVEMWKVISSKGIWHGTMRNLAKDGSDYYVKSVIMPLLDDDGDIVEYVAARTDVSELIRKDEIIKKQYEDDLTHIQNRSALHFKLNSLDEKEATLILLNIDRFSDINDYFGYDVGDYVLKELATEILNRYAQVFRISGDEFAILCEHELDEQTKNGIVEMIVDLESKEYTVLDDNFLDDMFSILLSCGVAYGKKNEIYKFAHIALKENKTSSEQVVFYNDNKNLIKQIEDNIKVTSNIKSAISEDRIVPVFQAIVDNKTKKVVKYETLIRLKDEDGKLISPFFFLEHSKKVKLYTKLTKIMIRKAFEKFADEPYEFSINLLLKDIQSYKVVNTLMEHLEKYKCGSRVVLEIVESEGIENFDELLVFIKHVKRFGCKIAIDDFGTGYSNFSYLAKLNVDYIKIDGSLVTNIDKDEAQRATVESILHFAKKMNIKTIAEFVEDEAVYDILNKLGVDFSQGYLFSIPQEELL
jgi:PAS domain S-box-containing protein/diguanylate cyclase (GGDEF)-like protein